MPTREIADSDGSVSIDQLLTGDPALLVSGDRNQVTISFSNLTTAGSGPAVLLTGTDNYILVLFATIRSNGTIAILGSEGSDSIVSSRSSRIEGDISLGGGNDSFQNNHDSLVGAVRGGGGDDALMTFQGTVSVRFFGDEGNDYLGGGAAADMLDGGDGDDRLEGNGGNDSLEGGAGADRLTGGAGDDRLTGGGGDDVAVFAGFFGDYAIDLTAGSGTIRDTKAEDGDDGVDTISGIDVLRFADQEIDTRITRNEILFNTAGEVATNGVNRYGFNAVVLAGAGATFVNTAEVRGTGVPHARPNASGSFAAVETAAVGINADNLMVRNAAGASIVAIGNAVATTGVLVASQYGGFSYAGNNLNFVNDGAIRSSEGNAIAGVNGVWRVTNNASGVIAAAGVGIMVPNGNLEIVNKGLVTGGWASIAGGQVLLTNSGTIIGLVSTGYYTTRIDNSGSIAGGYHAGGGLTMINSGESRGDLDIDVDYHVFSPDSPGFQFTTVDNRNVFVGDIRITGETLYTQPPARAVVYSSAITNSGTLTGSIVSTAGAAPLTDGSRPPVSFSERVSNSGTITGDVRLGAGDDAVVNSGRIGGTVDLGAGDDRIALSGVAPPPSSIDGGDGVDTLSFGDGHAIFYDAVAGTADHAVLYRVTGFEIVTGTSGNDRLIGGTADERFDGGGGDDVLSGGGGIDRLVGGAGRDTFRDTIAGLNGDTIVDLEVGDRIVILDASLPQFAASVSGTLLSFSGGTINLGQATPGRMTIGAAAEGGVQITFSRTVAQDFNGDGRSDVTVWRGQPNGSLVEAAGLSANALDASWRIAGLGDFNGDGRDDILWRHSTGVIGEWLGQSGVFTNNSGVAANAVDNSWVVAGVADYNGDGRDDILWRHSSGEIGQWLGQANGSFINNGGAAANKVDTSWTVVASGDFNGDGRSDILWRHSSGVFAEWQGSASGALVNAGAVLTGATGSVVGAGDFNGDGRQDILMRSGSGVITVWMGQTSGQFTSFTPSQQLTDANWKISQIGDFNGDGRDDLIWLHSSGATGEWLGTATGDFAYNGVLPSVEPGMTVQHPGLFLI
jgi:Ca2+-binding RTX toxin-like protein